MNISDEKQLLQLAAAKMPFGKYAGSYLSNLPEHYLVWFKNKGFPEGKLGEQLGLIYSIQENGQEFLLREIRMRYNIH